VSKERPGRQPRAFGDLRHGGRRETLLDEQFERSGGQAFSRAWLPSGHPSILGDDMLCHGVYGDDT